MATVLIVLAVLFLIVIKVIGEVDSIPKPDRKEIDKRRMDAAEWRVRELEMRARRKARHFRASDHFVDIPAAKTLISPTEDEQVDALFAEIAHTLETGESDLRGLVEVNPDPSPLELELMIGPTAWIVANQSLIGEIQNLWDAKQAAERKAHEEKVAKEKAKQAAERKAHEEKVAKEKADRELAKRRAASDRAKFIEARKLKARLILGERNWKRHQRRVLRGLACSNCYGQHPVDICVADTFHAARWPVSMLSPYSEELGMYGHSEDAIEEHELRSWNGDRVIVRTIREEPLRVKRPPRLPRGWN